MYVSVFMPMKEYVFAQRVFISFLTVVESHGTVRKDFRLWLHRLSLTVIRNHYPLNLSLRS